MQAQNAHTKNEFITSFNKLNLMLQQKNISLKEAYYSIESAWGNCYLSYNDFSNDIDESAQYIKIWLSEKGHDSTDNLALQYGICSFLRDTLEIYQMENGKKLVKKHIPFKYDYTDFKAEADYRNSFVTKVFATGYGQCNTLPAVYLILAEAMCAKAWLSYAPHHAYIKFPDNKGVIYNYDPTTNTHISDELYQDYLNVTADAERNKIYLDTLTKKQVIASCLIDLAYMYMIKFNYTHLEIAENMVDTALTYFHDKEANIYAWFVKSNIYRARLYQAMDKHGITEIEIARQIPALKLVYDEYINIENKIKELGHKEIPQEQYNSMMQQYSTKQQEQALKGIDGKQKRNMFLNQ